MDSAVLVTLDTTRYDALGVCGAAPGATPALDALARESLLYDWCRSVAPLTLPSHASMFTGLYPPRHGVRDNGPTPLPSAAATLAEAAREAGLETAAFVASAVLDPRFGFDQGFDVYEHPADAPRQVDSHYSELSAEEVISRALEWLRAREPSRPFFLWVHLFDPHAPYEPPARFLEQAGGNAYAGEVAYVDAALQALLAELRRSSQLGRALVAVVGDHGEDLWQHGEPSHASFCYDTTLRVPFLLRYPDGYRAGERSDETVSVVDVFPTVLAALGLGPPAGIDGSSLFGASVSSHRGVYFETYYNYIHFGWSALAGWADARGKYIHSSAPEFYDPRKDPAETSSMAVRADAYLEALRGLTSRSVLPADRGHALEPELLEELARLGYAASDDSLQLPPLLAPSSRPSPRERTDALAAFLHATALVNQHRFVEAIPILRGILVENPDHLQALDVLGFALAQQSAWPEVERVLSARLSKSSGSSSAHLNLALALEAQGKLERARVHYERALALRPAEELARAKLAELAHTR